MIIYNSFDEMAIGTGQVGSDVSAFNLVTNEPRRSFMDGRGGVDWRLEDYVSKGIVQDKAEQIEVRQAVELGKDPKDETIQYKGFYGIMPSSFTAFQERTGEILVDDGNGLEFRRGSEASNLGEYFKLPDEWYKAAVFVDYDTNEEVRYE